MKNKFYELYFMHRIFTTFNVKTSGQGWLATVSANAHKIIVGQVLSLYKTSAEPGTSALIFESLGSTHIGRPRPVQAGARAMAPI